MNQLEMCLIRSLQSRKVLSKRNAQPVLVAQVISIVRLCKRVPVMARLEKVVKMMDPCPLMRALKMAANRQTALESHKKFLKRLKLQIWFPVITINLARDRKMSDTNKIARMGKVSTALRSKKFNYQSLMKIWLRRVETKSRQFSLHCIILRLRVNQIMQMVRLW